MWKDFFYFSRGQKSGIIVLIVLIVLAFAANYFLPYFFPTTEEDGSVFLAEVETFKKSLVSRDSLRQADWQRQYEERQRLYEEKYKNYPSYTTKTFFEKKKDSYTLFPFDPNTIDSAGFVRLGLKPFIASNILKYRSKGGRFKTAADFAKVYGIFPDKIKELEPYITIAELKPVKNETTPAKRTDIIVDLNSADTTLLMQVKGIGRGYAKGIVRFRQSTGGFVSVDQLSEIFGMRPENLEKIRPFCTINMALVQKIKVNTATAQRLDAHPYLNFYQARAIYELRRNKGKLHDVNDLKVLSELTTDDLMKIKPYLSFE
ncbi:MAG TPA: helix-hairpin-helix domain-containing protein [Paludibacter sp.]